ncbi:MULTISPECIES: acyl-CoA dehydrogenase family protein [unclassified Streptomyces]|uniref:acyl-CoA dehydrogenase family protein n=1 Tax=unclassified Streptomyces TaxID=2593676 RepID=UPI002E130ACD|nr:acyl-CoA dehydrogenase family protein [Streptomyces sp. NBC_01197]WSS53203.1 acyl-CoA dehydrogenase family protein [Streptomyces sp. NBC_01180]
MDFERSDTQRALLDALGTLLNRHAGPQRCRELTERGAYDHELETELRAAGFLDVFGEAGAGPLEATLAVEQISAELGAITPVPHLLVLPALGLPAPEGPVVLADREGPGPVRYGSEARQILVVGADRCGVAELSPDDAEPVPSAYGYPLARVVARRPDDLAPGTSQTMMNWWRVGACAEALGMMQSAFDLTVQYAKDRTVFGRALGSFQALQHRLSEVSVLLEGVRWLTYEAAFRGATAESSAVAASHTMATLHRLTRETHQITGAVGLTREHDLHLWTLRLQAIRAELGGLRAHQRAVVTSRWEVTAA